MTCPACGVDVLELDVFIFSFNRGAWLANLLSSIERHVDPALSARLVIFDDHSTELETLNVLAAARSNGVEILHATEFHLRKRGSRGGLHAGIEAALAQVARPGSLALLLQDDMQIIRPVKTEDIANFHVLASRSGNPFVYVNFWTGGREFRVGSMEWRDGYYVKHSRREGRYRHYTDVCIVNVDVLRASPFRFHSSEKAMDHEAARHFGPMAWSPYPVSAMLPDPVVYRDGEAMEGRIYRFNCWDAATTEGFLLRPVPENLPIAEDFLTLEGRQLPAPWKYGVESTKWQRLTRALRRLNGKRPVRIKP